VLKFKPCLCVGGVIILLIYIWIGNWLAYFLYTISLTGAVSLAVGYKVSQLLVFLSFCCYNNIDYSSGLYETIANYPNLVKMNHMCKTNAVGFDIGLSLIQTSSTHELMCLQYTEWMKSFMNYGVDRASARDIKCQKHYIKSMYHNGTYMETVYSPRQWIKLCIVHKLYNGIIDNTHSIHSTKQSKTNFANFSSNFHPVFSCYKNRAI
jgi:hypothetical protein